MIDKEASVPKVNGANGQANGDIEMEEDVIQMSSVAKMTFMYTTQW